MRIFCLAISVCVLCGFSTNALADPKSYCELFGKDYADSRSLDVDHWQTDYRNALSSCMTQYTAAEAPAPPKEKEIEFVSKKVINQPTKHTAARKRIPLLAPGSVAWNEYCASKYVSYNKVTGTYKSYSGKAKPCLVPSG